MPKSELKSGDQVEGWLKSLGASLSVPASLILIGSGGLLWHAAQKGVKKPLPTNSMDVDPITDSDEVAGFCYDASIGSEFEKQHGWHLNLMPDAALSGLPEGWKGRQSSKTYGLLTVYVPAPDDLLVPKVKRGEPRDLAHARWAFIEGLAVRSHVPLVPGNTPTHQPEDPPHDLRPGG
jgi:hypothetical protein